ncbi:MAG: PKD domain-containing protein, partial [Bacteroidota bacterium]
MRVAELLEASAKRGDKLESIRYKLGAVLAKDVEHQKRLYRLFDEYVRKYSAKLQVKQKEEENKESKFGLWWERNGLAASLIFAGLLLMSAVGKWYAQNYLIELNAIPANVRINHLSGDVQVGHESRIRQYPPIASDEIVETRWDWGDGSDEMLGDTAVHRYTDLTKEYRVKLYQLLGNGTRDTAEFPIRFENPAEVKIRPNVQTYELKANAEFMIRRHMLDAPAMDSLMQKELNSLAQKMELSWELGDGSSSRGDSVKYEYKQEGEYTLVLRTRLKEKMGNVEAGRTFVDSIPIKVPHREELPLIPVSKIEMTPPDISDLVKHNNAYGLYFILSLIALGLYGLYEYLTWRKRKVVLDDRAEKLPPLRQKLKIEMPELNLYGNEYFGRITTLLRMRRDSEVQDLNLALTLKESIHHGGEYPVFAYSTRQQASQYLVLIEERNKKDHLARFYESLVRELNHRDITAEYYFYDHDPSLCWNHRSQPATEVPLSQLLATFAGYRLIIIGTGKGFLDPHSGELAEFTHLMDAFPEKALLSTLPNENWGRSEQALAEYFSFVPATEEGWEELVPQWQADEDKSPWEWQKEAFEVAPPSLKSENYVPELRTYLGEKRFQWLCACAVYPILYYELTLQLGSMITEEELDLEALGHLFRLDWFRKG